MSQSNTLSFTMFASLALLGKNMARSDINSFILLLSCHSKTYGTDIYYLPVARIAFFITSRTSLYSSGLRQSNMLFSSLWRMFTPMEK